MRSGTEERRSEKGERKARKGYMNVLCEIFFLELTSYYNI